jgi:DnaK suppressor protein
VLALQRYPHLLDADRARQLLARERQRIQQAITDLDAADRDAAAKQNEPGEGGSEALYEKELDAGIAQDLAEQLAAVERAEGRLEAGSYGLSIQSGRPIPDERLEALPTAERAVDEQQAFGPG